MDPASGRLHLDKDPRYALPVIEAWFEENSQGTPTSEGEWSAKLFEILQVRAYLQTLSLRRGWKQ